MGHLPSVRPIRVFFCAVLVLLTASLAPRAYAIGFQPVSPDELKMTSEPKAPGATAIVLFRQVDRNDNNPAHEDNYYRIKVLKEEGRSYANVEIPYEKGKFPISGLHARSIRPDGTVVEFNGKPFDKTIVKAKGVKYLAKTFTLPDVQVGSIIEYYYTVDFPDDYIFDSHWIVSSNLFTKEAHFSLKRYTSSYSSYTLRYVWRGIKDGPKEDNHNVIRMTSQDVPAFVDEDYMPPANEYKARVDFIYTTDSEQDKTKFWRNTGKKMNGKAEDFIGKHREINEAVAQIVGPSDTPEEKARKLYMRVQQLRNLSYEERKSEAERKRAKENKEINNVADVWKRGYGDGDDITLLYAAMLRAAGIDARLILVSDRYNYFFTADTMESNKLDTFVVEARFKDHTECFDPGALYTPYGMLPWAETDVPGLRLNKDGGEWVTTPLPDSSKSQVLRAAKMKLNLDTGALEGTLKVTYTGLVAARIRVDEYKDDAADRKKYMENEVREAVPVGVEVELTNQPVWDKSDVPLVAEYKLTVPGWAESAGRRVLLQMGLFSNGEKKVFEHAERTLPIYFAYPLAKKDDITIELPEGWAASSLPAPTERVQKGVIGYITKAETANGALHVTREYDIDLLLLPAAQYSILRNYYHAMRASDEQQIVLQRTSK